MDKKIIILPISYQQEGILKGKRKPGIYDFIDYIPVEVTNITHDDANLIALYEDKNIAKPYMEYNGSLYEPFNIFSNDFKLIDTKSTNSNIINIFFNIADTLNMDKNKFLNVDVIQGVDVKEYQQMLKDKKIFLGDIDEDIEQRMFHETFSFDNSTKDNDNHLIFRTILSSNEQFKIKNAQKYADNLLLINGKIFIKSIGPTFEPKVNYREYSLSHPLITNDKHVRAKIKQENNMLTLSHSFPYALFSILNNNNRNFEPSFHYENYDKNKLFVFEPFILYETTKQYLGEYFFNQAFGNLQQTIDNKYEVNTTHPERKLETWFQSLKENYTFGEKLVNTYYDCFKSNFDINVVYQAIKTFALYEKHFSTDSVLLVDMQKYIEPNANFKLRSNCKITRPSDREIINDTIKTYKQFKENILLSINNFNNDMPTIIMNDFKSNDDISECVHETQALNNILQK